MKQIRRHLTYANVMSSLAVFLMLGGATAFAATKIGSNQLKANSIKTGKIVKEAVTTGKLKKNAVTNAKIADNSVTGSKVLDGSLTGSDINLGTLGTVPSANNANNANNANATNGMHLGRLNFIADAGAAKTSVFSANGLTLSAECDSGSELDFTANTSVENAEIMESGNFNATYEGAFNNDFDPGETEEVGANIGDGTQEEVQGQLVYSTPSGGVVTAQFSLEDNGVFGGRDCALIGTVQFS